ncbi:MAG: hypothetical protein VX475_15380, partial [Myxococcota bacterium]|nr:hypothetical protein [Myxococcota bacterium]
ANIFPTWVAHRTRLGKCSPPSVARQTSLSGKIPNQPPENNLSCTHPASHSDVRAQDMERGAGGRRG